MTWSKTRPSGTKALSGIDDDHRENNEALEDAIDLEHDFTTADTQSGRHKFGFGDETARNSAHTAAPYVDGGVFFRDDLGPFSSTKRNIDFREDDEWEAQTPPVYPDEVIQRSKAEWGLYVELTVVAAEIDWDWDDSNAFKVTLTSNTELKYPTDDSNALQSADLYQPVILHVTQDDPGGWDLTYEASNPGFRAPFGGATLSLAQGAGETSIITFQSLPDNWILVNVLPDLGTLT